MQLKSEDDDFGEEVSAYAAAFRCIDKILDPRGDQRDLHLGVIDTNGVSHTNLATVNCHYAVRDADETEDESSPEGNNLGNSPECTPHDHASPSHQIIVSQDPSMRSKQGDLGIPNTKENSSIQDPSDSHIFHSIAPRPNLPRKYGDTTDEIINTPNSLNWTSNTKLLDRYRLVVPMGRCDGPYFELLSQWSPPTEQTPFKVFLDQQA